MTNDVILPSQGGLSMSALDQLTSILSSAGLKDDDINMLLGRFLEEEAEDYVECMSLVRESIEKKERVLFS